MIRWCFTHEVGWDLHEQDSSCQDYPGPKVRVEEPNDVNTRPADD